MFVKKSYLFLRYPLFCTIFARIYSGGKWPMSCGQRCVFGISFLFVSVLANALSPLFSVVVSYSLYIINNE